jgi:Tol biopolymer transport system component
VRRTGIAALLLGGLLVAAGCGGSTPASPSPGPVQATSPREPSPSQVALPAPGRLIAFLRGGAVYVVGADGTGLRALTAADAHAQYLAGWSPDGRLLLFSSAWTHGPGLMSPGETCMDQCYEGGVYVLDVATGRTTQLAKGYQYGYSAWSPHGAAVAHGGDSGAGTGITVVRADGSDRRQLTTDGGLSPMWSPNGRTIAYAVDGSQRASVVATGPGEPRLLGDGRLVAWLPDGSAVVVEVVTRAVAEEGARFDRELRVLPLDGSPARRFDERCVSAPTWSRDGSRLACLSATAALVILDGPREMTLVADATAITWSPDGRNIAFAAGTEGGGGKLFVADVETGLATRLTTDGAPDDQPAWQPAAP